MTRSHVPFNSLATGKGLSPPRPCAQQTNVKELSRTHAHTRDGAIVNTTTLNNLFSKTLNNDAM